MSERLLSADLVKRVDGFEVSLKLELSRGELVIITGPSGAGKSTALKMLSLLVRPESGTLYYKGKALLKGSWKAPPSEVLSYRRRVPLVSQVPALMDGSTLENVSLPLDGKLTDELMSELRRLMVRLGFDEPEELLRRSASKLSVGEAQRVCLVRALLLRPEALLLDEPTASLDEENRRRLEDLLVELIEGGLGVIMVTHDLSSMSRLTSRTRAHRVYEMRAGRLSLRHG